MANLATAADLAAYLGVATPTDTSHFDDLITAGQTVVEAYLTGDTGWLGSTSSHTETTIWRRDLQRVPLKTGPASTLTSVTVNGVTYTARFELAGYYSIRLVEAYPPTTLQYGVPNGSYVTIAYERGWTAGSEPASVTRAVLIEAAARHARPDASQTRKTIGPVTIWHGARNATGRPAVSEDTVQLLSGLRSPRVIGAF